MYIYNVTINIQEGVEQQWLDWMQKEHIPAMLNTGKFTKALLSRVNVEEPMGGVTYSVQYTTRNKATLDAYYQEDAAELRKQSKVFEGKFVAFRTELEIIDEQHE
ncbi:DUF4286 family protein [Psychroflexus planctonicus]|uniref:DUF4286 family protein n=1 Tax=Psychroflexus planctonicus TaxID=1526575 RepID=A0ABQ1SK08_9FLAO|nr:DUF4286 family protein [Psychroflexus planctonicus]GGE40232.1 hypothetical protein GCM10010832_20510 [Psychroflexus planctonicus]